MTAAKIRIAWVANGLRPLRTGGGVAFAWVANRLRLFLIGGGVILFVAALLVGQRIYSAPAQNPSEAAHCAGDDGTDRRQADRGEVSNGKIAFARGDEGLTNADIYVIEEDGTDETRLTNTGVSESLPVWSPDGEKIAFTAGDLDIYVMDSDGTNRTPIAHFQSPISAPSWSPDGERMVFVKLQDDLYVMSPDGTNRTLLTSSGGGPPRIYGPVWSPDGEKIGLASETFMANDDAPSSAGPSSVPAEGLSGIYISNADDPGLCKLTEIDGMDAGAYAEPTWSPDGDKIAFYDSNAIYLINPDGSGRKELTGGPSAPTYHAWSPDGERIAFVNQMGLYVINADGSEPNLLTDTSGTGPAFPTWSPDGEKIAFSCPFKAPDALAGRTDLCVINADGTGRKRIASNVAPEGTQVSASWGRE